MNAVEPPSSIWNCLSCRRRKVRCDRRSPCTPCTKAGSDCAFPVSGRLPTRRDEQGTATADSRDKKQADLLARLKRLEGVLRDLGVEPDGSISTGSVAGESSSARTIESHQFEVEERMMVQNLGSMVVSEDATVYIPSKFWKHITEEVSTLRQSFEFEDQFQFSGPGEETSNFSNQGLPWAPFCPHTGDDFNPDDYQPLPSQMAFIWQTYCENVDHAVKVLHRPCVDKVIRESKGRFSSLSTSVQALLFAISIASIASMSERDVQDNFRDSRTALLRRLSTGAEACLSKSDVLNTTDIRLLQAFVLYIEAKSQEAGNRASWCLTGLAVRIALLMGLHRDGSHFSNIAPFDVEMRRRVWWHVCLLDSRSEEAQTSCTQMSVFGILHDTDLPTNIDDGDLDPHMACLPVARDGITDTSLFIARCQLWHLAKSSKRHGPPPGNDQVPAAESPPQPPPGSDALNASRAKLEDTFFRHLRQDDSRHVFFADVVRHSLAVFELNSYLHQVPPTRNPPAGVSCPGVNRTFVLSLAVLELSHYLESCPETSGWYWALRPPVPWRTMSALLVHSHKRPWSPTCERAWACITSYMATSHAFRANCKKDVLWIPVRKLLAEAAAYRTSENQRIQGQPEIARRLRILKTAEQSSPDWTRAPCHRSTFDLTEAEKRLELEMQVGAGDFSSSMASAEGEDLFSLPILSSSQANSMTVPDFSTGLSTDSLSAGDMGWEDLLPDGEFLDSAEAWDAWDQMMAH